MSQAIWEIKAKLEGGLVDKLAASTKHWHLAVVSYRDITSQQCGNNKAYASRLEQTFTQDINALRLAVDSLYEAKGCSVDSRWSSSLNTRSTVSAMAPSGFERNSRRWKVARASWRYQSCREQVGCHGGISSLG